MQQKPSVGRIVHYVSHGSPVLPDGSQAFSSECRAAVVTEVSMDEETVGLAVLNPTGQFFNRGVPHAERQAGIEHELAGGSWHWPERT